MKKVKQFVFSSLSALALVVGVNITNIQAHVVELPFIADGPSSEVELPSVEDTPTSEVETPSEEDTPIIPDDPPHTAYTPPFIQLEAYIDAQGYQITSPVTYVFNIKDESGLVNQDYTVVIDPNNEDSGFTDIFLDFGIYTITQISADNLENYTFNGSTYHNNSQQIDITDVNFLGNCIIYSVLNHYTENKPLSIPETEESIELEEEETTEVEEQINNFEDGKESVSSETEKNKTEEEKTDKDISSQSASPSSQVNPVEQTNVTKEQPKKTHATLNTNVMKSTKSNKDEDMQQMANKNTNKAKNPISLASIGLLVVAFFTLVSVAFKKYLF